MRRILVIVVVCVVAGAAYFVYPMLRKTAPEKPVVSGTIETDEVHVASRYGGRVIRLGAAEGAWLKPNEVVIELDAAELAARRDQAAAILAELEAGARPEELDAAKNEWQAQAADLELAQLEARRATDLFTQKTISETERDRTVARARTLEKNVAAAKARHDLLRAGARVERIRGARAQLAEIDTQIREMKVLAPTNCLMEVLNVKVGDVIPPNREVATLLLMDHLWVRVYVPETWLGFIKPGEKASVRVDSFPGRDFPGEVEQVQRSAEFTPRNVQTQQERVKQVFGVKIRLPGGSGDLRPGMSADVLFPGTPPPPKL